MLTKIRYFALFAALGFTSIAGGSFAQITAENDAIKETVDDQAITTLRELAESGNADARFELGERYLQGLGVPQSYSDAKKWFEKASMASNHAGAQYTLGLMYENGEGVPKSCTQAIEWFRLAAAQNYDNAGEKVASIQFKLLETSCETGSPLKGRSSSLGDAPQKE